MHYPVVINMHGIDELILLQDATAWHAEPHLHSMPISTEDRLIDSTGAQFSLQAYRSGALIASGSALTLAEVMILIQRHAAQDGACCIAKIKAPSISAALQMLA